MLLRRADGRLLLRRLLRWRRRAIPATTALSAFKRRQSAVCGPCNDWAVPAVMITKRTFSITKRYVISAREVVDGDYECAAVLHGHEGDVKAVRWHPIERLLFSASYDDTVRVWAEDEDDWYCIDTLRRHTSTVWSLAVEPAGERLATAGADGNLIVWKRYPRRP
ncbi:unnamed protein product, partial [Phaeothamnion confervicola]